MKHKSEVGSLFKNFYKMIQTQYSCSIKVVHSDNGGEFVNHTLTNFFTKKDILHETTCPQTPKHNGVA